MVQRSDDNTEHVIAHGGIEDMKPSGDSGSQLHELRWEKDGIDLQITTRVQHEVCTQVLEERYEPTRSS